MDDLYGASPYDGAYFDMEAGAGPSRPPPIKYDDPYSDSYGLPDPPIASGSALASDIREEQDSSISYLQDRSRGRGRGRGSARDGLGQRGRGRGRDRPRDRGRGRGRGRGSGSDHWGAGAQYQGMHNSEDYPGLARPLSPTSAAIARATGQYSEAAGYLAQRGGVNGSASPSVDNDWGYQQYSNHMDYNFGYQQPFVQPHINPRFASQFGMSIAYGQPMQYPGYGQYGMSYAANGGAQHGEWSQEWGNQNSSSAQPGNDIQQKSEPS